MRRLLLCNVGLSAIAVATLVVACSSDDTSPAPFPSNGKERDGGSKTSSGGDGADASTEPSLPLTCEWMRDASKNCWHTVFEKVKTCVPADEAQGTLSSDRGTCTYTEPAGTSLAISPAAATPWSLSKQQKLTMSTASGTCFTFEVLNASGSEYRISSSEGFVEVRFPKPRELTLVCPDGKRYGGNADTLFDDCGSIPGISTISNHDLGISMFVGDGQPFDPLASLTLMRCD